MIPLPPGFFDRDPVEVAPELLNAVLVVGACRGRVVEVEAYRADDPASHSFRGPTPRAASMFGPPGCLYVYFTYGMHFCANVVTGPGGEGSAVLLRAVAPLDGVELMRARRPQARTERDLTNGPAKLCQAFGIDRRLDGASLGGPDLVLGRDEVGPPGKPGVSTRIGIRLGRDRPWRFFVSGDAHVSRGRPS